MRESTVTATSRNTQYNPAMKSEITELLAEPLSLSETAEPTVSPSDTELGFSPLVAIFLFHVRVHKVNYARIFTIYAHIMLTP